MKNKEQIQEQDQTHKKDDVFSDFTCEICVEPAQSIKKFSNSTLCRHPFCLDCIAKYIEAMVEDGGSTIKCPALDCNHQLDPLSCQPIIPKDLFIRWCDRLCDSAVSETDKCYCPNTTCSTLILNECKNTVKKTKCPNCKREFCFKCNIPWHAGYWCSETGQLRDNNDVLLGKLVEQRRWIRCYKCGHAIEKNGGCRKIRCRCGSDVCYGCGRRFHFSETCEADLSCWQACLFGINALVIVVAISYVLVRLFIRYGHRGN